MRKLLLTTASTLALTLAGAAIAADRTMDKGPAAAADVQTETGIGTSDAPANPAQRGTEPDVTADAEASTDYRSYDQSGTSFSGAITGDMSADELLGTSVVDKDGSSVGKISDLLIGHDGNINKVMVDVGGFLGMGARTVALDLAQLQPSQGSGDDLVTDMTKEQLQALPRMVREDKSWREAPPETERKLSPAESRNSGSLSR